MKIPLLFTLFMTVIIFKIDGTFGCLNQLHSLVTGSNYSSFNQGSTILVATGYPRSSAQKTEVINLKDNSKCQDVEDFPLEISSAVGSYLGSFPVICGGWDWSLSLNQCHRLESGIWKPFATLAQRRSGAVGIVHANIFIIFGGYDNTRGGPWATLSTTEIVTEEGQVTPGPEMPAVVWTHAIARLNETTSILTGGSTQTKSYSKLTWYFDHVSQEFRQGPSLITGRRLHASATLQDHDTKEDIVAVVGGYYINGALDSIELLRNGVWSPGKLSCKTNKMCLFSFFLCRCASFFFLRCNHYF